MERMVLRVGDMTSVDDVPAQLSDRARSSSVTGVCRPSAAREALSEIWKQYDLLKIIFYLGGVYSPYLREITFF